MPRKLNLTEKRQKLHKEMLKYFDIISQQRDGLRELQDTIETVIIDVDEALELLDQTIQVLSQQL